MKLLYKLLLVLVMSISAVVALFLLQDKPPKNGFNRGRTFLTKQLAVLDLTYNSWYIKELNDTRMLLGNIVAPVQLSCNYALNDTVSERLPLQKEQQLDSTGLKFDLTQAISPNSRIVNGYSFACKQKALQKVALNGRPTGKVFYKHQMQQGEDFSIDGFLNYNKELGRIIFTYYYRNRFVCLDTNLKVLYTANMIDTNTIAKIKVAAYESDGKQVRTMAGPAFAVNKRGYSDGNFVFVESALAADNEYKTVFDQHVVLDVYSLGSGKYSHSIYLPKYKGRKLRDFAVKGDLVIALYGRHMITYLMIDQ